MNLPAMNCARRISYTIRPGDNLYQLSRYYQTTVTEMLLLNSAIDPYNLQVGSTVIICPGEKFVTMPMPGDPIPTACPNPSKQMDLSKSMRLAWLRHVNWVHSVMVSIIDGLKDQKEVAARALQTAPDISAVFAGYYSPDTVKKFTALLAEHLQLGAALFTAMRDDRVVEVNNLNTKWYDNTDRIADEFSSINPFYDEDTLRKMLNTHLDLEKQISSTRLAGNYQGEIDAFGRTEKEILGMADYFASGIMSQFPHKFS